MAMYGIGKTKIQLMLQKADGKQYLLAVDGAITLSRAPNAASSLSCTCLRNNSEGTLAVTPENGEALGLIIDDGHMMFWGYIFETKKKGKKVDIVAYDQLTYLAKNTDAQAYGNVKASELYTRIIQDNQLASKFSDIMDTEYTIPDVVVNNSKYLDVLEDALNITYRNTGRRFYIRDAYNNLCLQDEELMAVTTLELTHNTIQDYSYNESINDMYNVIKIQSEQEQLADRTTTVVQSDDSVNRYGRLQYFEQIKEGENAQQVANTLLSEKNQVVVSLSVTGAQGDPRVWGGSPVFVDLFTNGWGESREFIRGWFRTENVTHHIEGALHTMDLELTLIEMYNDWNDLGVGKS